MWRGPWPGRLLVGFAVAQAMLFGLLALWPWVGTPLAALQAAELRAWVWLNAGFALMALMALPLFVVRAVTAHGPLARGLVLLALAASVLVNWQMASEYARLLPLREAPMELARALVAARLQGTALALLALAALILAHRAEELG
ncbi:MAG: hypothetical protein K0B00_06755 [Rhodobacteraceae bacterium]|nr:hypothetical protein [Paracoccaceae bacterium]